MAARKIRGSLAAYEESRDLIELGAYVNGTNPALDSAIRSRGDITNFLRQDTTSGCSLEESYGGLLQVAEKL
jgi:flagellum-specific ATP synthase